MFDTKKIKERDGVTLIELLIVISIIGILSMVGIPEYGRFIAKNKVRSATSELLQNMRLAKAMAIKENREYQVIFDYAANTYRVGFDGNNDNILDETDAADGFGSTIAKVIDLGTKYGSNVVIGSGSFTTTPPNGPNWVSIANAVSFQFNPDGSVSPNGSVYFQHDGDERGYTFSVELANTTGTINLYMWQGHAENSSTQWTELR